MTLDEYQQKAMTTCMPSSENFSYMFLNLVGEVGEIASKVAKSVRKERLEIHYDDPFWLEESFEQEDKDALMLEAGDVLWQLSGLCSIMNWRLEDVAKLNLDKLASRKARDVIDGDGDNR